MLGSHVSVMKNTETSLFPTGASGSYITLVDLG